MEYDDEDDEFRPALPVEDRLWRHPSEYSDSAEASEPPAPWGTAFFSALGGAMVVGALWMAMGTRTNTSIERVTERVAVMQAVPNPLVGVATTTTAPWTVTASTDPRRSTVSVIDSTTNEVLASAIALRDDGMLSTSATAIAGHSELIVEDSDGNRYSATVIGTDALTETAVLSTSSPMLPAVMDADRSVADGDLVAVIVPREVAAEFTVNKREAIVEVGTAQVIGVFRLSEARQDTPAGSPVVNTSGVVVGMVAATNPDHSLIVVPIDMVRHASNTLVSAGRVDHPRLGVSAKNADADSAVQGALVTDIDPTGSAGLAGLQANDVITSIDDVVVESMPAMIAEVRRHVPGDTISVELSRGAETVTVEVELQSMPADDIR